MAQRTIGRWDFEGGSYVHILADGDIPTEEVLDMVDTLVELKRKEIAAKAQVLKLPTQTTSVRDEA